jgi:hypothetical protein
MDPVSANVTLRRVALSVVASGLLFSACSGENLFSLAASAGALGPTVLITAPGEGFTISVGDSIQILADVTAPEGATSAAYRGNYTTSGDSAYTAESEPLNGLASVRLDNRLRAVEGQAAGSVYIVVEVTDRMGEIGQDSVKITIN